MKKETEEKFAGLFRRREAERRAHQERQDAAAAQAESFRRAFGAHMQNVIRPAFEDVRILLARNGVDATISERSNRQREGELAIGLYVHTGDTRIGRPRSPEEAETQLVFTCNEHSQKVSVYEAKQVAGGRGSGPAGDVSLDMVTADYIHEAMFRLMER